MQAIVKFIICAVLAYSSTMELISATRDSGNADDARGYLVTVAIISGLVVLGSWVGVLESGKAMMTLCLYAFVASIVLTTLRPSMAMVAGDLYNNTPIGSLVGMAPVAGVSILLTIRALKALLSK
jgi:hypothetical protein